VLPCKREVFMSEQCKPQLALVLGSGGVRSIAALGMVEVLAREGIAPDLIVGCSAGALFGALISMGHAAPKAVEIATGLWTAELTRQHRWNAIPKMVWPRWGGFDADFSMRDDRLILSRLCDAFGATRLEELELPLRVTATDSQTGDSKVICSGRMVDALRASIAMPFMFAPQLIDGRRVIDGFVSDPLPVSAASDAHAVIALGFEAPMPKRIDGPSRLLAQITSSMTNNLMQARLAAAKASGMRLLHIAPVLERRVGLFDTGAMPYLVEQGRLATQARLPSIIALLEHRLHLRVA
jgi:NTE family protein